jgi:DNA (cytosine-5)-methyltransferase 1
MRSLSLFTGAGGLDIGLHAAGFRATAAVEMDRRAVSTLSDPRNARWWGNTTILPRDVTTGSPVVVMGAAKIRRGQIELLSGGPPCQPFSKSGYWRSGDSKRLSDPRARTLEFFFDMVESALPMVVLLENVPGIRFSKKDEGIRYVIRRLQQINKKAGTRYVPNVEQLAAVEYGVPQTRERVFVVASANGEEFRFPAPTHFFLDGDVGTAPLGLPCLTAWDAIGSIEDDEDPALLPKGKYAKLLPSIPEGSNYLFHTSRGGGVPLFGWRTRYWSMLLKLAKSRPSWTLTAQPGPAIGPFHWNNRRLSAAELCGLQTIPTDYCISGSVLDAHRQLGNAVPALLTELIGFEIRRQLFGEDIGPLQLSLLPARATPAPPPGPLERVPQAFMGQIGNYPEHPGTGKGPGAAR